MLVLNSTGKVGRGIGGGDGLKVAQGEAMFNLEYEFWVDIKKVSIM